MDNSAVASVYLKLIVDQDSLSSQMKTGTSAAAKGAASSFSSVFSGTLLANAVTKGISLVTNFFKGIIQGSDEAYKIQLEAETKLETIMRQRMDATESEIQAVKDLASELQGLGVIGDEVTLSGAQQLATFLNNKQALDSLLPAMTNLLAQQKGLNASAGDAVNIGNLMGKVMQGQTAALTRVGITFTEAQEEVLKYGTELERAAMLAEVITDNVGDMNSALMNTEAGKLQQVSNAYGDVKEKIGEFMAIMKGNFVDVMMDVIGWLDKAADHAIAFAEALRDFMIDMGWKKETEEIKKATTEIGNVEEAIEEVKETAGELAGFDEFNLIGQASELETETSIENLEDLVETTEEAEGAVDDLKNTYTNFFDSIRESSAWQTLSENAEQMSEEKLPALKAAFDHLAESAGNLWDKFATNVLGQEDLSFLDFLVDYVSLCAESILDAVTTIIEGFAQLFELIGNIGEVGAFEAPYEGFEGVSLFGVPLIETVDSAERHAALEARNQILSNQNQQSQQIVYTPNIYIGNEQLLDYTIDGINEKSVLKGYSVIK